MQGFHAVIQLHNHISILRRLYALNQLGIARSLVNMAFTAVAGAFAVAVAIAFGVGGKDFAARLLQKLEDENEKPEESSDADDNADVAD